MAVNKSTSPLPQSVELLEQALRTGIRGRNKEAIEDALELLRDDGSRALTDLHYKRAKPGTSIRDPDRPGFWMRAGKRRSVWLYNYNAVEDGSSRELQLVQCPEVSLADTERRSISRDSNEAFHIHSLC